MKVASYSHKEYYTLDSYIEQQTLKKLRNAPLIKEVFDNDYKKEVLDMILEIVSNSNNFQNRLEQYHVVDMYELLIINRYCEHRINLLKRKIHEKTELFKIQNCLVKVGYEIINNFKYERLQEYQTFIVTANSYIYWLENDRKNVQLQQNLFDIGKSITHKIAYY